MQCTCRPTFVGPGIERLRYPLRYRARIPRNLRLCRFCGGAVKDEVHALFDCTFSPHLVLLRSQFLAILASFDSDISAQHATITNYAFLLKFVSSRKGVKLFAKYVYEVLAFFDEPPRYFPQGVIHPPPSPPLTSISDFPKICTTVLWYSLIRQILN
ncbi:hypothetical protein C8J57DRAFT_1044400 [Mycena rebaudengoi]|nr:hypothetical protein C8J57DRAFT_1044400 [Mycena rebaudengoi]